MRQAVKCRVYAAGGCGINIGSSINNDVMNVSYIDTSESNRSDRIDSSVSYYIDGLDGSGKRRAENHKVISREIASVMDQFPPGDFNIVLFSAGGGSGSVIGPLIVKELLSQKHATVAVVVGADDSNITVENTINTLKSLESISILTKEPVVMAYAENTQGVQRSVIDDQILFVLESLAALTSQDNRELDTRDLVNWVQYQKVSSIHPQLSFLHVMDNRAAAASVVEPVSVASLYADAATENPFGNPHYRTVGFPRSETLPMGMEQVHCVINLTDIEEAFNRLQERQSDLNRTYNTYRARKAVVDLEDHLSDDGLVL